MNRIASSILSLCLALGMACGGAPYGEPPVNPSLRFEPRSRSQFGAPEAVRIKVLLTEGFPGRLRMESAAADSELVRIEQALAEGAVFRQLGAGAVVEPAVVAEIVDDFRETYSSVVEPPHLVFEPANPLPAGWYEFVLGPGARAAFRRMVSGETHSDGSWGVVIGVDVAPRIRRARRCRNVLGHDAHGNAANVDTVSVEFTEAVVLQGVTRHELIRYYVEAAPQSGDFELTDFRYPPPSPPFVGEDFGGFLSLALPKAQAATLLTFNEGLVSEVSGRPLVALTAASPGYLLTGVEPAAVQLLFPLPGPISEVDPTPCVSIEPGWN